MSHLKPDDYVPQAIRTSFWQPSPTEDEDMVLASSKTKPLVSVLSSLTKIGDDQIRRKIEQNEDVIENDYSNTVHSVLNCFKKRMNVIEECELFDESDDDYEIDVDKLIESENSLSEKFRKRSEDPNFYRDYNGEGSLHSDKASAMSNRSKGVIPIEKSTGPIFGSHKRIDEVTYKNYINAKKPSTLVVSKVQGLQPRIDTTGVPLRENERYKKFEDYVIDKKKQAEEDHRMKDFRKSPYSVTNIIKVTCKKKSNDAEKLQKKEKNNDRTIQKSQRKNIVSTCATKTRKRVKKVVEHHHHYYKDGQVVHTEVTTLHRSSSCYRRTMQHYPFHNVHRPCYTYC
ncbi:hypothetical protein C9374_004493 [Naegleria lovaniensis]|uniref:Uncharacterized protein n=1 Tax=Naegleria lovaniensis TaxID=51637 RepID=A0AA88GQ02_NAELO|nr:uncharacterized protein C9374_004493 [Naegleria lovaniensis]KAG2383156.1 hypothetical protein C9374_004493 [Naegleria lovaniensis]